MGDMELPKALEEETQMEYFRLYSKTKEVRLRDLLVEHNIGLVLEIIRRKYYMYDRNDMLSYGLEGLSKAVEKFDVNRGCKFSTFANKCIISEIRHCFEYNGRVRRTGNVVSLSDTVYNSGFEDKLTYLDVVGDSRSKEEEERFEIMDAINGFLFNLSDRDRTMFEMSFGINGFHEYKQEEIAETLQIKRQWVSYKTRKILADLRAYFVSLGFVDKNAVYRKKI